jgi:hypothetical protein
LKPYLDGEEFIVPSGLEKKLTRATPNGFLYVTQEHNPKQFEADFSPGLGNGPLPFVPGYTEGEEGKEGTGEPETRNLLEVQFGIWDQTIDPRSAQPIHTLTGKLANLTRTLEKEDALVPLLATTKS